MRLLGQLVWVVVLLGLLGCSSRQQTSGVEDQKKQWVAEGWSYLETFGRPAEDAVMVAYSSSATARKTTAFARTDGVATNHAYTQTQSLYLVVSIQRPGGDAFALVFTKPKP
jgi:hypothetical protein